MNPPPNAQWSKLQNCMAATRQFRQVQMPSQDVDGNYMEETF